MTGVSINTERSTLLDELDQEKIAPTNKNSLVSKFWFLYSLYFLFLIFLYGSLRQTYRGILPFMGLPIKRDLKIGDTLFGVINGPIFSASHAFFGIIFGRLTDTFRRTHLLAFSCLGFSFFNTVTGLSTNYWHLIFCRIGLAAFVCSIPPLSMSLLADSSMRSTEHWRLDYSIVLFFWVPASYTSLDFLSMKMIQVGE